MSISPCAYPGCRDENGDPRLTQDTFCESCQWRYRRLLDWIVLDYVTLTRQFPKPYVGGEHVRTGPREYGHPAEWASITAAGIADALNWAEDALRDTLGHEPPPHPGVRQDGRVAHAWRYLTAQFGRLCEYDSAMDTAVELDDMHYKIRRALGHTRIVQRLPAPCPWCDIAALTREVGSVACGECGKVIDERHYDWLAGWLIDRMIEDYDTQAASNA